MRGDENVFYVFVGEFASVQHVGFFLVSRDGVFAFGLTEKVDYKVMGDAGDPCREFAGVGVSVLLDGCYCLDESLLKDVVCNIFVFDSRVRDAVGQDVEYVVEHTVLMSTQ